MSLFEHPYNYDPGYGYTLERLLGVDAPTEPADFEDFWSTRYRQVLQQSPRFQIGNPTLVDGYRVNDISYQSTDGITIAGWLLEPHGQTVTQAIVVGHGYGGREGPDFHLSFPNTALLFPCFRGISRSRCTSIPERPDWHVVQNILDKDRYVIGGCVDDLWLAVSVLWTIYPQARERIGYMGISFGGGIGALAVPWDGRIRRVHLNVPTFGNQPLRLSLPSCGSADALRAYSQHLGHIPDTLTYYDAATAVRHANQPLHAALALFDPVVAPPGQFAIYNAWHGEKRLFTLDAGHFEYPAQRLQEQQLLAELKLFFSPN
ncbi:acetylxylan esterase [Methylomonas sp. MED-D]|uniref:Deacetylase n=1 Tax=Methylomonas koyamae TaxID=702114 RepID=A0A177NPK6_9GAMM|nr:MULTISPECIES: acetylxylan esterase [Methylomonas]MDT4328361.1 acetylxylan esterase [Methylomonas sp. MV1]NJA06367.1 deacetylase [Methylococcaceae bacterium WWC4]OAI20006.1 deacetylase [Methylomonas koyamae]OHX37249.1 deacetylase [Methylomonas sp. LWB]